MLHSLVDLRGLCDLVPIFISIICSSLVEVSDIPYSNYLPETTVSLAA